MSKKTLKLLALSLVVLLVFAVVAGCGEKEQEPAKEDTKSDVKQESKTEKKEDTGKEKPKHIAFEHKSLNYYAFGAMHDALKTATEERGWTFESAISDFDSAKQSNHILNYVQKGADAIITDPIDSDGIIETFNQANQAGIPVMVIDTPTTGGDVAFTIAFDNFQAGQMAASEIVDRLVEKYGEEKGVVLNAYGAMSSWAWRLRREGFADEMAKHPDVTYVEVPAEGDMKKTNDAFINTLAQYGTIDACHAPSDNPGLGLVEAMKQKGLWKKVGEEGHVILVTIDAEPVALEGIRDGYYDATINQDCVCYGEIPIEMLEKYTFQGKEVPSSGTYKNDRYYWEEAPFTESPSGPYLIPPAYVIDETNVDDERHWANIAWNQYGLRYN